MTPHATTRDTRPADCPCSDHKRQADALEDLETSEGKKLKLSAEDDAETADVEALDSTPEPAPEPAPVAEAGTPEPAADIKGKGKAAQGADVHFKENPYTFLKFDDPVIQACMYAPPFHLNMSAFI